MENKYKFGIIAAVFYGVVSCGTTAPDVGENECFGGDEEVAAGSGGSASVMTGVVTSGEASSMSGAGAGSPEVNNPEVQEYDVPHPDEISSRLHSCHKLTYSQLGNFLSARGVAVPRGNLLDTKNTQTNIFGTQQTLSAIFGGSGSACEMAVTTANGTNDPVCSGSEVCFCNQDDKMNQTNRSCLDVGNNSPDAADGYCVLKPATAGFLYFSGKDAMGVAKLDSRLGEKEEHSTSSAMKLMDIFIQAAPQIITNIGDPAKAPACTLGGKNYPMFAGDGSCVEESVSCLIGTPATEDHMILCNLLVSKANLDDATDVMKKKIITVAALLSAAHTCQ